MQLLQNKIIIKLVLILSLNILFFIPQSFSQDGDDPIKDLLSSAENQFSEFEKLFEAQSPSDEIAREAAQLLRKEAIKAAQLKMEALKSELDHSSFNDFLRQLSKGQYVYADNKEVGTVRLMNINGSYVAEVRLNESVFAHASSITFFLYDLDHIQPNSKAIESLKNKFISHIEHNSESLNDETDKKSFDELLVLVKKNMNLSDAEARLFLARNNGRFNQFLSRFLLERDVQTLELSTHEELISAFYTNKSKLFSLDRVKNFVNKIYEKPTKGHVAIGLVCGSLQGAVTYFIETHRLAPIIEAGGSVPGALLSPEMIPIVAASWSFTYGALLGIFNDTYANMIYEGKPYWRFIKLAAVSTLFALVYKPISNPTDLITLAGWGLIATNIAINQYGKDIYYSIPRLHYKLGWTNWGENHEYFKWLPVVRVTIEMQMFYHILWAAKMLHFIDDSYKSYHLMGSVAIMALISTIYHKIWQRIYAREVQINPSLLTKKNNKLLNKQTRDFLNTLTLGVFWRKTKNITEDKIEKNVASHFVKKSCKDAYRYTPFIK